MNLYIILSLGVIVSLLFHFIGVYANAKKTIWLMLVLVWAGSISLALGEISPKGYTYIEKIKGSSSEVDAQIEKALPQISLYEMLLIRKTYDEFTPRPKS